MSVIGLYCRKYASPDCPDLLPFATNGANGRPGTAGTREEYKKIVLMFEWVNKGHKYENFSIQQQILSDIKNEKKRPLIWL